jgi:drug/metabolite transporter (DMT)-like permease
LANHWQLGLGLSLVTALMWALVPIALKGLLTQMDATTITWYRFSVSALIAMLWYGFRSGPALKRLLSRRHIILTAIACAGLLGNYLSYVIGLDYITASAAQMVIQLAPLLLLLGSVILFKERLSYWQWLGVATFSGGLLLFFHHRLADFRTLEPRYLIGTGMLVLSAIAWAAYGLAQKKLLRFENSNVILLLVYISGTLCYLPLANPSQIMQLNSLQLGLLGFVSLNTIVAYSCFGMAMSCWQASRVSATITLSPVFTLLFVELLSLWKPDYMVTEPLDWLSWLGGLLVVLGSGVAALAKSRKRP